MCNGIRWIPGNFRLTGKNYFFPVKALRLGSTFLMEGVGCYLLMAFKPILSEAQENSTSMVASFHKAGVRCERKR